MNTDRAMPKLESTITCPECGHRRTETMPTDACWYFYDCHGCSAVLRPKHGDCCVFCSFGDVPCPPVQDENACCTQNHPDSSNGDDL